MAVDKVTKTLKLNLEKVPKSRRSEVKTQVGEFVVGEILRSVEQGKSPVSGRGAFKRLTSTYADEEKGGNRNPNLELDGDMLNALKSVNRKGDEIEVGIFSSREVPKADGHNNFSGDSKLPTRRFIPKDEETFKRDIQSGINRIIATNEREDTSIFGAVSTSDRQSESIETTISINDLLGATGGDDIIRRLFGQSDN